MSRRHAGAARSCAACRQPADPKIPKLYRSVFRPAHQARRTDAGQRRHRTGVRCANLPAVAALVVLQHPVKFQQSRVRYQTPHDDGLIEGAADEELFPVNFAPQQSPDCFDMASAVARHQLDALNIYSRVVSVGCIHPATARKSCGALRLNGC